MEKTANQLYREYKAGGGTLVFKDWMQREKEKKFLDFNNTQTVPVNKPLNDSIQNVLNKMQADAGYKTDLENKYIFGVNKKVWIGVGIGLVVIVGIVIIYNHHKKGK